MVSSRPRPLARPACWPKASAGRLDVRGQTVVAVVTGHGLKDPDAITKRAAPPVLIEPVFEELVKIAALDD